MKQLEGRLAVVTGGGAGMGRELVLQLMAKGCHVATCDVSAEHLAATSEAARQLGGTARLSTFVADVSDEAQLTAFAEHTRESHGVNHLNLLFNNAGIGGGNSFVSGDRRKWERTFDICWNGVYLTTRTFLPMLIAADEARIVNTSSINGVWAALAPDLPNTAYCAAKFAVKGFTEALIVDLRVNAPHVKCSVVMPGHIGTDIYTNSRSILSGAPVKGSAIQAQRSEFIEKAPLGAAGAATQIIDGVLNDQWRILVGDDARKLDAKVRAEPERAYDEAFYDDFVRETGWWFDSQRRPST